jgi:hypothetical protein
MAPESFVIRHVDRNGTKLGFCEDCRQCFKFISNGFTGYYSLITLKKKPETIKPQRLITINLLISLNKKRGFELCP